jgi:hypothetical protein
VIVRLLSGLPGVKLNESLATDRLVERAPSAALYIVNGVAVPLVNDVIVTQPVQLAKSVKLPVSPPILAGLENVIEVDVKVSEPLRDNVLPGVSGAADATPLSPIEIEATATNRSFLVMLHPPLTNPVQIRR